MLALTQPAWPEALTPDILPRLRDWGIAAIEAAPGMLPGGLLQATPADLTALRDAWADHGLAIPSLFGLLFGQSHLSLFAHGAEGRQALLDHLVAIARQGQHLGVTRLAFGAPKARQLAPGQTVDPPALIAWFRQLGDALANTGVVFCLEAVMPELGNHWLHTTAEALAFIRQVDHPNVRLIFDTGAMLAAQEMDWVTTHTADLAPWIGHAQLSEPRLVPLSTATPGHATLGAALRATGYTGPITLELIADPSDTLPAIEARIREGVAVAGMYR